MAWDALRVPRTACDVVVSLKAAPSHTACEGVIATAFACFTKNSKVRTCRHPPETSQATRTERRAAQACGTCATQVSHSALATAHGDHARRKRREPRVDERPVLGVGGSRGLRVTGVSATRRRKVMLKSFEKSINTQAPVVLFKMNPREGGVASRSRR